MTGAVTGAFCFALPDDVPFCAESGISVNIAAEAKAAGMILHIFNCRLHEFEPLLQLFYRALDAFFFFFEFCLFIVGIVGAFAPHKSTHAVGASSVQKLFFRGASVVGIFERRDEFHIVVAEGGIDVFHAELSDVACGIARETKHAVDVIFIADIRFFTEIVRFCEKPPELLHELAVFLEVIFFGLFGEFFDLP